MHSSAWRRSSHIHSHPHTLSVPYVHGASSGETQTLTKHGERVHYYVPEHRARTTKRDHAAVMYLRRRDPLHQSTRDSLSRTVSHVLGEPQRACKLKSWTAVEPAAPPAGHSDPTLPCFLLHGHQACST
jgi:hypothetical protein